MLELPTGQKSVKNLNTGATEAYREGMDVGKYGRETEEDMVN